MSVPQMRRNSSRVSDTQREALGAAARWYAQLEDGAAESDSRAWQEWRSASPVNEWAWSRVELLRSRLQEVPGSLSAVTLNIAATHAEGYPTLSRRAVLKGMATFAVTGWLGYELAPWSNLRADYAADADATLAATLADGTRIILDARSSVRVDFDAGQRRLQVLAGEVLIETARDPSPVHRPFIVHTTQGRVRALGTRFSVRQQDETTRVVVLEHAVEIVPADRAAMPRQLQAGEQAWFTADAVGPVSSADERLIAWTAGNLAISDWTLAQFTAELSRYRSGWLRCAPEIAGLRISGSFPLRDTDAALRAVGRALPVVVRYRTPYWVTLLPR